MVETNEVVTHAKISLKLILDNVEMNLEGILKMPHSN
jgi:hypothetical protein